MFEAATASFQRPTTSAPPISTTLVAADARQELRPAPLVPAAATVLPTVDVDIEGLSAPDSHHEERLGDTRDAQSIVTSIRAPQKLVARSLGRIAMLVTGVMMVLGALVVAASQRAVLKATLASPAATLHPTGSNRNPTSTRVNELDPLPQEPSSAAPRTLAPEQSYANAPFAAPLVPPRARHASRPRVKAFVPPPCASAPVSPEALEPRAFASEPSVAGAPAP